MSYQYTVPRIIDIDACDVITIEENAAKHRTRRTTTAIRFIADSCSPFSFETDKSCLHAFRGLLAAGWNIPQL